MTKQEIVRLKSDLECAKDDLRIERLRLELARKCLVTLAAFAAGLINSMDPVAYKRAVDIINALQREGIGQ